MAIINHIIIKLSVSNNLHIVCDDYVDGPCNNHATQICQGGGENCDTECMIGYTGLRCESCHHGFYVTSGQNGFVNSTTGEGVECLSKNHYLCIS